MPLDQGVSTGIEFEKFHSFTDGKMESLISFSNYYITLGGEGRGTVHLDEEIQKVCSCANLISYNIIHILLLPFWGR